MKKLILILLCLPLFLFSQEERKYERTMSISQFAKELKEAADNGSLWDTSINVPGELSEYSIFWQTIKRDREKNTPSLLFVASRIDEIEKNCDLVRSAGYDPLIVDVRCFALRNILKTYEESESSKTQVFLEISRNTCVLELSDSSYVFNMLRSAKHLTSTMSGSYPALLTKSQFFSISSIRDATNNNDGVFFSLSLLMVCQKIEYSDNSPGTFIEVSQRLPLSAASFSSLAN